MSEKEYTQADIAKEVLKYYKKIALALSGRLQGEIDSVYHSSQ